jgi:hypothetical protein
MSYRKAGDRILEAAGPGHQAFGSRSRFIMNSMFADCKLRQLSTSVWYRSFG